MAFIASRKSRGKSYWSIVESRRVNGKPRNFILEYLGTAESLLEKLKAEDNVIINLIHMEIQLLSLMLQMNWISSI